MIKINSLTCYDRIGSLKHLYLISVMIFLGVIQGFLLYSYMTEFVFLGITLSTIIISACLIVVFSEIMTYYKNLK